MHPNPRPSPRTPAPGEQVPLWLQLQGAASLLMAVRNGQSMTAALEGVDGALRPGAGKRGGVRVVYFNRLADGQIWLLLIYSKSVRDNVPAELLKLLKQEVTDAHD